MKSDIIKLWVMVILSAVLFGTTSISNAAEDPVRKGYDISAASDRSDRGFTDSRMNMQMILRNKAGQETQRQLSMIILEVPDENVGDKSMMVFHSPSDIQGTALLSHAKILNADDQWLFLPSLKRVKRISSVNKSGPFMGSEFAFEDFTAVELNKYSYKYLRTEVLNGLKCDVVERYPLYKHSGYTKQISWIDQGTHQMRKIEFFNRRGTLFKTLAMEDYKQYENKYWRARKLSMINHQTGKSTDLIYTDFEFNVGLKKKDFVKGALSRLR